MPVDLKPNEWDSLREQFRALVRNEGPREDSLEQFVDDGIRSRFGEVIGRACGGSGKQTFPLTSEHDYLELAQALLLRRRVD